MRPRHPGRALRRIYGERDLLVAECLRRGVWNDLDAPGLAALAAAEAASAKYSRALDLAQKLKFFYAGQAPTRGLVP